jgi:hypothetical protein
MRFALGKKKGEKMDRKNNIGLKKSSLLSAQSFKS